MIRFVRSLRVAGRLCVAFVATVAPAVAAQWDLSAGDFHTHLIGTDGGFQLHVHDKATHRVVDTRPGRVVATMLAGGRQQPVPLAFLQPGVLTGARALAGDWTLLVRLQVPGMKPAVLRYSSRMKPGSQDVAAVGRQAEAGHAHGGHDHAGN